MMLYDVHDDLGFAFCFSCDVRCRGVGFCFCRVHRRFPRKEVSYGMYGSRKELSKPNNLLGLLFTARHLRHRVATSAVARV